MRNEVIDLLLLGTGAMVPLPHRWLSAMIVRHGSDLILFDCGEGTQISMRQQTWGFRRLGTIFLTHLHADHVAGLPGLLHTIGHSDRADPVTIFGPVGAGAVVAGLLTIATDLPFDVEVVELDPGASFTLAGGFKISTLAANHRIPCLAYRADLPRSRQFLVDQAIRLGVPQHSWRDLQQLKSVTIDEKVISPDDVLGPPRPGISFGFLTDSRPPAGAAAFFKDVGLLICEGTYCEPTDREKANLYGHMTVDQAAAIAADASASELWITHFSPAISDPQACAQFATGLFPATTMAYDGLTTTLAFPGDRENLVD